MCSYTCIGGLFGYFIGFFYLPLFSTLIPRSVRKKVRSLRRLPSDRDIRFRKESPVFVVRTSSTSNTTQQQRGSSNHRPLLGLWHLYTFYIHTLPTDFGVPNTNDLQRAEPRPCQSTRPITVSCCGRSEAAPYPTPEIKTNIFP